jgi:hypothetical protein
MIEYNYEITPVRPYRQQAIKLKIQGCPAPENAGSGRSTMKMNLLRSATAVTIAAMLAPAAALAQPQADIYERIRKEGTDNSQVMKHVQVLTDVYGPRG